MLLKAPFFKCRISVKYIIPYINGGIIMKKIKGSKILLLVVFALSILILTGCGEDKSGNTIDEPEITVDYLTGEYANQLTTDGAEIITGFVTIEKTEDSYIAHIREQEVVPNSNYDDGYYIADTNLTKDAALGSDARMTCDIDGKASVVTADEFIDNNDDDSEQLYNVYLMGDSAELILEVEPETVIVD